VNARTGEPRLAGAVSWLVLTASFGLSAATWVALAMLAGFSETFTIPSGVVLRLAWLMPIAYDGYVVVALIMWMAPVPARVARFARTNTYAAAALGVAAQSSFHTLTIFSTTGVWWRAVLAAVVGAIPPAVAGLAVHMRALIRRESAHHHTTTVVPAVVPAPATRAGGIPTPTPAPVPAPPTWTTPPQVVRPTAVPVATPASSPVTAPVAPPTPTVAPVTAPVVEMPPAPVELVHVAQVLADPRPVPVAPTVTPVVATEPVPVVVEPVPTVVVPEPVAVVSTVTTPPPPARPARAAAKSPSKRQPSAAEKIAKAVARTPNATNAKIADRLGLSEATVARHRRHAVDSVSTQTLTTSDPAEAVAGPVGDVPAGLIPALV